MGRLLTCISLLLSSAAISDAGDYCSLVVHVQTPSGGDVKARIAVEEETTGRVREQISEGGSTRFCELGFKPVTITIGGSGCNQVVIKNVPLRWQDTRHIFAVYDRTPCLVDPPPVAACTVLLRFFDRAGTPISSALFKSEQPDRRVSSADQFGRVLVRFAAGRELVGHGMAEGFAPYRLEIPCISSNYSIEKLIVLDRR